MEKPTSIHELTREQLIQLLTDRSEDGVKIQFSGKANARRLARQVRPRIQKKIKKYTTGDLVDQSQNLLIEGDNLQSMVTLYRERGQVDLIVTDPPYNTGNDFRYNDRWDDDPNDPGMGELISEDEAAKHTKWMRFMLPRLHMMKAMLTPSGVIAICIDHRELFHLGQMMDELFGERNRLAIINWQKTAAGRPDKSHVSTSTEYVLVYARNAEKAKTASLERKEIDNIRYSNPDDDSEGLWREGNLTARTWSKPAYYGIQSPFTGDIHYPAGEGSWRHTKKNIQVWLEEWGSKYEVVEINDGHDEALMIKGGWKKKNVNSSNTRLTKKKWPFIWFGRDGLGRPRTKTYLEKLKKGKVPVTYWADDDMSIPAELGSVSWDYTESGRSSDGVSELTSIVGKGHNFTTVKPLKLMMKIIQLWCPGDGLVLDPFVGSGTTAHAVLALNSTTSTNRRFIAIEQGRPEAGDSYARTLTTKRLSRVINGKWENGKGKPVGGGYRFAVLDKKVDADALLSMEREEMVDTVIASYFDNNVSRRGNRLITVDPNKYRYLVAQNSYDEGFFLVWDGPQNNTDLTEDVYEACSIEANRAGLKSSYHIYARYNLYQTENVRFYQIPDRILVDFGLDIRNENFAESSDMDTFN